MHFVRITRDEAKENGRVVVAVPRAFVVSANVDFFFVFSPPFALFRALCGTERGGRRGLSRDVFNAFDERRLRRDD
jgi:hypothetical protein